MALQTLWKTRLNALIDRLDLFPLTTTRLMRQEPLFLFARGLIFSSSLLEEISQDMPRQYSAGWGQMMTEDGTLSREVDIIVYEGTPFHVWRTSVMRFTIVPKDQVKAVIECCEYLAPTSHHKEHVDNLSNFAEKRYLYAECCWTKRRRTCGKRRQKFLDMGYSDVFCLYRWYYGTDKEANVEDWCRFLQTVRGLQ